MNAIAALFGFIPGWIWAAICAGAIATSCTQTMRLEHEQAKHAGTRAEFSEYRADIERQRAEAIQQARQREQELADAATQAQAQADALRQQLDRDRVASGVASQRLRDAAQTAALNAAGACSVATSAAVRDSAAASARVLSNVLGELDQRAGALADLADRSRAAGLQCQTLYDAAVKATR